LGRPRCDCWYEEIEEREAVLVVVLVWRGAAGIGGETRCYGGFSPLSVACRRRRKEAREGVCEGKSEGVVQDSRLKRGGGIMRGAWELGAVAVHRCRSLRDEAKEIREEEGGEGV
jgi:hypothetical protein